MSNLSLHIEYLLRHHDCVILPGVGAFMKAWREASIDADGTILPPASELTFNSSIQSNDGLLAHSLMRRNGTTFEEAKATLSAAVEELKATLRTDREIAFGHIGILSLGDEDNLSFAPFSSSLPKAFRSIQKVAQPQTEPVAAASPTDDKSGRRFDTRRNYYVAINKRFARIAAALIFVVAAASTFVVPSLRPTDYANYQRASVVPIYTPTPAKAPETHVAPAPAPAPEAEVAPEADIVEPPTTEQAYYLIVATFKTPSECQRFIESQPAETAKRLRVKEGRKVSRVYIAATDDRQELVEMMHDTTFKTLYSQAWIWHP